jgi:hypothetical protein
MRAICIGIALCILSIGCRHNQDASQTKDASGPVNGGFYMAYGQADPKRSCLNEYGEGYRDLIKIWGCVEHKDPAYIAWEKVYPSMGRIVNAFGFFDLDMDPARAHGWPEFVDLVRSNGTEGGRPFAVKDAHCDCVEKNGHFLLAVSATFSNGTTTTQNLKDHRSMEQCKESLPSFTICSVK